MLPAWPATCWVPAAPAELLASMQAGSSQPACSAGEGQQQGNNWCRQAGSQPASRTAQLEKHQRQQRCRAGGMENWQAGSAICRQHTEPLAGWSNRGSSSCKAGLEAYRHWQPSTTVAGSTQSSLHEGAWFLRNPCSMSLPAGGLQQAARSMGGPAAGAAKLVELQRTATGSSRELQCRRQRVVPLPAAASATPRVAVVNEAAQTSRSEHTRGGRSPPQASPALACPMCRQWPDLRHALPCCTPPRPTVPRCAGCRRWCCPPRVSWPPRHRPTSWRSATTCRSRCEMLHPAQHSTAWQVQGCIA